MAFATQNQGYLVPIHQLIDLRPVVLVPGQPIGVVINPNNGPPPLPQFGPPPNLPFLPPAGFTWNRAFLLKIDQGRTRSLLQFMIDEGLVPSPEEEMKRRNAIDKLKQIVMEWVKSVAYNRGLRHQNIEAASATVLTYGSYGLGVHSSESDIDALCVGPRFATIADDFFNDLREILASRSEVSEVHCVKDARVPLMRFKLDGISIDLPYAKLNVMSVPENVDILNPYFLQNIDETSWRSLSGVHANKCILRLLPNVEVFQSLLRCVKLWAKRRGLYGNLLGFLGGVHLAILAAFICQRHPNASLNGLLSSFFRTFAGWPWPTPVVMEDGMLHVVIPSEMRPYMPIRLPCRPHEYCHSNVTRSTFYKIRQELIRGHDLTKDPLSRDSDWVGLFDVFPYKNTYRRFVKICLSASDRNELGEWVGWVKSRFRGLLMKLEEMQDFCDPNPTEYVDPNVAEPNVVFYWGLNPDWDGYLNMAHVKEFFRRSTSNGYRGKTGKVTMSIVSGQELPKNAQFEGDRKLDIDKQQQKQEEDVGCFTTNVNTEYPSGGG